MGPRYTVLLARHPQMSVKRVGIYVTFRPAVDLRAQGLGRQLAGFLRGSAERSDLQMIRIVAKEAPEPDASANGADPVTEALGCTGEATAANWSSRLDRSFFSWYWPLMART